MCSSLTGEKKKSNGSNRTHQLTRHARVTADLDRIFDLLCSARRRYFLYYLYGTEDDTVELEDVIDAVCAYEASGTDRDGFPPREQVRTDLYHNQIPRLAHAGIVDYDRRQGTIQFCGSASLEEWLEHARYLELD